MSLKPAAARDTLVSQGSATGYLATSFEELGRGLTSFAEEMDEAIWRQTIVVVISEFGRLSESTAAKKLATGTALSLGDGSLRKPVAAQ
ncbi:hypothetical protein [Variovorax sp. UC122_21]|uniref:hypothetical protein n=1 Tax=Variovorax sp. UC122_21 TaxID=3374554 RepID=UPI00375728B1